MSETPPTQPPDYHRPDRRPTEVKVPDIVVGGLMGLFYGAGMCWLGSLAELNTARVLRLATAPLCMTDLRPDTTAAATVLVWTGLGALAAIAARGARWCGRTVQFALAVYYLAFLFDWLLGEAIPSSAGDEWRGTGNWKRALAATVIGLTLFAVGQTIFWIVANRRQGQPREREKGK